eukprot:jgi/Picre1/33208/NNA_008533.t1
MPSEGAAPASKTLNYRETPRSPVQYTYISTGCLPACYSLRINKSKATANTIVAVIQKTLARIGTEIRMNSALNAQRRVPTVSARPQRAAVKVTAMKQPSTQRVKRAFAKEHQSPIDSMVMYISEAFSQIFRTTESQVPWSGTSFSGRILHHENAGTRNRSMNPYQKKNVVAQAIPVQVDEQANGGATNFVVDSIGRIMGAAWMRAPVSPKGFTLPDTLERNTGPDESRGKWIVYGDI